LSTAGSKALSRTSPSSAQNASQRLSPDTVCRGRLSSTHNGPWRRSITDIRPRRFIRFAVSQVSVTARLGAFNLTANAPVGPLLPGQRLSSRDASCAAQRNRCRCIQLTKVHRPHQVVVETRLRGALGDALPRHTRNGKLSRCLAGWALSADGEGPRSRPSQARRYPAAPRRAGTLRRSARRLGRRAVCTSWPSVSNRAAPLSSPSTLSPPPGCA
jgi:hypothetical protein